MYLLILKQLLTVPKTIIIFDIFQAVADYLYTLVTWLMGAPAGLKLNKQLTEFLGHFFLYHIYLWKSKFYMLEIKFLKFFFPQIHVYE